MIPDNRMSLYCKRTLRNGIFDSFHVVTSKEMSQEIAEKYRSMGYEVTKEVNHGNK